MSTPNKSNLYGTPSPSRPPPRRCAEMPFANIFCPAANCNGWLLVFKDLNTDQPCDLVCSNSVPNSDEGCKAKIFFSIYCSICFVCGLLMDKVSHMTNHLLLNLSVLLLYWYIYVCRRETLSLKAVLAIIISTVLRSTVLRPFRKSLYVQDAKLSSRMERQV